MKKTVTYRRVNNKLRTKNRDLSRHKRCQAHDRGFGNNGGVSSLGVDYMDSDGDGYKDKVTKTRRAQSLHRDPQLYGGSQAIRGYYSRKVADSTAPAVEREFTNVVIDEKPPRNPVLDKAFRDSGMYAGQGLWDTFLNVPFDGVPFFTVDRYALGLNRADVTATTALVSITLNGTYADPTAATPSVRLGYGVSESLITASAYDPDPATRDASRTFAGADAAGYPTTLLFGGGGQHTFSDSPFSAGTTVSRSITGLSANTTYYYCFNIPNNDFTPSACGPLQSFTTLAS